MKEITIKTRSPRIPSDRICKSGDLFLINNILYIVTATPNPESEHCKHFLHSLYDGNVWNYTVDLRNKTVKTILKELKISARDPSIKFKYMGHRRPTITIEEYK